MDETKHLQIVPLGQHIEWYDEATNFAYLLRSINNRDPMVVCDKSFDQETELIPSISELDECLEKGTTYDILTTETHYMLVFLLKLARHERAVYLYGNIELIGNMPQIMFWRGKAYYMEAEPYDMYLTSPQFDARFMERLKEFRDQLCNIEQSTRGYKIKFRYIEPTAEIKDVSLDDVVMNITFESCFIEFYTSLSCFSSKCLLGLYMDQNGCILTIYNEIQKLLDVTNTIWKFIIHWSNHMPDKSPIFEPHLIYNILDYLRPFDSDS
jgi:hypothetical protein